MNSGQQLSVIYVYSSGGYRNFSQKQSSSESRVCIIFFFSLLLSLLHCYCYFFSSFFFFRMYTHQVKRSYLIWTPASALVFIIVSYIICLVWSGVVWCGVIYIYILCLTCIFSKFIYLRRFNYPACTCTN